MMPTATSTLTARLRREIAADHDAIEKTPFSIALIAGELNRETYALNLAQMHRIHSVIEQGCENEPSMAPYFLDSMRRVDTIRRDLKSLGFELNSLPTLTETSMVVTDIEQRRHDGPTSLVGGLYILEGSRMGSMVLAKPLASSLGITPQLGTGIDYHLEGAHETPARLKQWKKVVDDTGWGEEAEEKIAAFAVAFMKGLLDLYRAIPIVDPADRSVA